MSDLNSVTIDGIDYGVEASRTSEIAALIKAAMESGSVVTLNLVNAAGREVTVYFNGKAASTAAIDFDTVPRPTEISGSG